MAEPKTINYAGGQKVYNAEKVDQEIDTKVAAAVDPLSDRLDAEIQRTKAAEGNLATLKTTDKSNLVAAINELKQTAYVVDKHVTAGSTNPVESSGIKEYVDTQDETTLQDAKDYTDDIVGELNASDGSTVVELTGHLDDLDNAAESLVTAINNVDARVGQNTTLINSLDSDLAAERQARIQGDQTLTTRITQVEQAKQNKLTFDDEPTYGSDNPVKSSGIKNYVDEITGKLDDLDSAAESLVTAINNIDTRVKQNKLNVDALETSFETSLNQESAARIQGDQTLDTKITQVEQAKQDKLTFDDEPTHGSDNPVTSTGIKDYVDEITGQLDDLVTPAASLVSAINNIDTRVEQNKLNVDTLETSLDQETAARIQGDQELDTKITQVEQAKQDKLTFDDEPTHDSDNPVTSTGIKDYVDGITGQLDDLEIPAASLVSVINQLSQRLPETEEAPTEGSNKIAKSGGTWDAIRFASVKVGETMYWHLQDDSSPEDREVHSDNPFIFNFKGQEISVETHDGHVQLCVLKDIPDGWHALDGKAELLAADYPDLAAFMPENVTIDGKIWLPYVQHKIIKIKY